MKIRFINKIGSIFALAIPTICISSCGIKHDFTIVKDYLIEMPTYTSIDYDYAQEFFKENPIKTGLCSAVVKDVKDDNHLLVGRNMDYAFSKKCAYVIRTDETDQDKYKTLGFAYATNDTSPDFEDVKKHGISEQWRKVAPFFCTDIINEEGLYCEIDMRNIEKDQDGHSIFRCDGTNKDKGLPDVHMVALTRFVVANCKDVPDAIDFVTNNINVYNKEEDWNFSFILADASGNYGLLEFAYNQVKWMPQQNIQTNYFLHGDIKNNSKIKFGIGRYNYLHEHLNDVKDKWSMFNLINQLSYSNVYKGRLCPFDMRSESSDLMPPEILYEWLLPDATDEQKEAAYVEIDKKLAELYEMTEEEKRQLPWYWQSTFTEVVDVYNKSIHIRMFEDNNYIFDYSIN